MFSSIISQTLTFGFERQFYQEDILYISPLLWLNVEIFDLSKKRFENDGHLSTTGGVMAY